MPYTPPGSQSPAASKNTSPILSRSSSYADELPRSPSVGRPAPPRSHGSAAYIHKHRRTPSIGRTDPQEASKGVAVADFAASGSIRQSPPPLNNLAMPTGAVLSPPESPDASDGETPPAEHSNWDELQLAVRAIDRPRREGSPERPISSTEPVTQVTSPTALAPPRRSGHSRASSDTTMMLPSRTSPFGPSPINTNTDNSDDDEDDGPMIKPSLVRKKSGELVKPALRASSRRRYSSMPGTPTYSKSVHFNDSDNQTRHFLQVDKPIAVSAGSSPVETYDSESEFPFEESDADAAKPARDIRLANFPADSIERRSAAVRVERIFLSQDRQTLIGVVAVQNIDFHKLVVARFTLDYWKTTSEVTAEYNNDPTNPAADACDRFNFHIKLSDQANIDNKTLLLCVRYSVGGREFWDNNASANYQIDFTTPPRRPAKKTSSMQPMSTLGQRPLNAIPRSRHSPPATSPNARGRRRESLDDDFAAARYNNSYSYSSQEPLLNESPAGSIRLKPRAKPASVATNPSANAGQSTHGLGGRYDFGASLSAALSNAQQHLGRQSGLMGGARPRTSPDGSYFGLVERKGGPIKANERPDELSTDRPAMGSDQYKDLVQKFCYFTTTGPTTGKPTGSPSYANAAATDSANNSSSSSTFSSGTTTPATFDGAGDSNPSSAAWASFITRAGSPGPAAARAASPNSFGYPYHQMTAHETYTPSPITG